MRALYPLCTSFFSHLVCCSSRFSLPGCSHIFPPGSTGPIRYREQLPKQSLLLLEFFLFVFPVCLRPRHHIRHKVCVPPGPSQRDLLKQILEIILHIHMVDFCSFYEGIQDGVHFCAVNRIGKQPVGSAYRVAAYDAFACLCEHSHKQAYPQKSLMRIFCRKAA